MLLAPITFFINSVDGSFAPYGGGANSWPFLFQGDTRDLQIGIVTPTGQPNSPYVLFNGAGVTLYVTMGATPKGDGSQTIYAGPLAMTWNAGLNLWQGSLSLAGANLAAAIGTASQVSATWEVNLNSGGIPQGVAQGTITILAPENPGGATVPQPPENYSTTQQANALYVPLNGGAAGQGRIEISPNGTKYLIARNNDGTESITRLA